MRIAIARQPFADGLEITAVRPIIKLNLDDYTLSEKLKERLAGKAEGILIAGPPGSGKSTFAASLAEFYLNQGKIVKTMESPRDLDVPDEITQYSPLNKSFAKTSDILLLVRPDYTIFDEVRKTNDFEIFSDMRLAGVGMIGVMHSTAAVDAIQRFLGRIELGVIPHVVDTIVYIKDGEVRKVYNLSLTVRVPAGMTEQDLARPLVEVKDFESGKIEYEIYTYGEQTVVVPVKEERKAPIQKLAAQKILEEVKRFDRDAQVEFISDEKVLVKVENSKIPRIIGREGKVIKSLEDRLGISIDVQPLVESMGSQVSFEVGETGAYIIFVFKKNLSGKNANIYIESEYLFSATIGRSGQIKINKGSDLGKQILRAITGEKAIKVFI
jgi:ATPase